jgi:bis(5'-nucleosyl)-tetraphosphatase (symmetrical)
MAIYLVGDIQGCFNELTALLTQVDFDREKDILYLAGDLVARGPNSLETLRFVKALGNSAKVVLGNHDLHLLAVHAGLKKAKSSDYLSALLAAPDINELMDWLASQPLLQKIPNNNFNSTIESQNIEDYAYMSHAGISPQWQLSDALEQAELIHRKLASSDRKIWLSLMYGEEPNNWRDAITDIEKFRYSINAFTRMRFCFLDGSLEFTQKDAPDNTPITSITPWYELSKTIINTAWVFGHWASLMGKSSIPTIYPLDTGCVWGNELTMLRWHDKKYFKQSAEK